MGWGFEYHREPHTVTFDNEKGLSWTVDSGSGEPEFKASEKSVRDYLTGYGVENMNIKSVKLVEAKIPSGGRGWDCVNKLQTFAEHVIEGGPHQAQFYSELLMRYCGVEIEYQL